MRKQSPLVRERDQHADANNELTIACAAATILILGRVKLGQGIPDL